MQFLCQEDISNSNNNKELLESIENGKNNSSSEDFLRIYKEKEKERKKTKIERLNIEREIRKNKICNICGNDNTYTRQNGKDVWIGIRNDNDELIGLSCTTCYDHTKRKIIKKCCKCGYERPFKYLKINRNDNGYWDGSYICANGCAKTRIGELDPDSKYATGYITEKLIANFLGIETCSDITGRINQQKGYDLWQEDWERIQSKGSRLIINNGISGWQYGIYKNIGCDFFFCIGYDEERRHVESMLIIPNNDDICRLDMLFVPEFGYSEFDIFEEDIRPWDDLFHTMRLDNCTAFKNR